MHALASGALTKIQGMSRCALRALETTDGVRDMESIAQVLQAISEQAEMACNGVDVEAERVGVSTIDKAWQRRSAARCVVRVAAQNVGG